MSSSNSPCAACKYLRRKCTKECDFAPYFLPENPQRFTDVHRVFGASNVAKLLKELNVADREEAVKSLVYEAEYRIRDPVNGCVRYIWYLQQYLEKLQQRLIAERKQLDSYNSNPQNMHYMLPNNGTILSPLQQQELLLQQWINNLQFADNPNNFPHEMVRGGGGGGGGGLVIQDFQHQHREQELLKAQQLAAAQLVAQKEYLLRLGGGHQMVGADMTHSLGMGNFGNDANGGDGGGGGYQIQNQQGEEEQHQGSYYHHHHHHVGVANANSNDPQNQEIGGEDGKEFW